MHPAGDHGALEQVAAVLGEDHALARGADLVTCSTDALEATGDARRALDLDDEVDRAHVDAELERARGHERGQPAGLELFLDLEPLFAGDAAVVGPDELLPGELVEALRQPFAQATAVGEHDGAAMALDQIEDRRVDGRPDARAQVRADGRAAGLLIGRQELAEGRHVVDRHDDLEFEWFARAGVDDSHVPTRADAAEEAGDPVEGPLGRAQADPLRCGRVVGAKTLEPLEAEGEVGATLGAGDGVDLIDDDVLDAAQDIAGLAGEQQVQALGGRDEDVGRATGDLAPVLARGVAGAASDRDVGRFFAETLGGQADAGERRPKVALDVVRQGLERGDVQDADVAGGPSLGRRAGVPGEAVEGVEEGGQGLAAPRGRVDQCVFAARDRRPSLGLGLGRSLEARLEPGPDGR